MSLNLWEVAEGARKLREKFGLFAPLVLLTPIAVTSEEKDALADIDIAIEISKWLAAGTAYLVPVAEREALKARKAMLGTATTVGKDE